MPRDIPVGNGDLLVNFDELYRVRDLYYPCVGRYNHTGGHVQRFGVWADGELCWIEHPGWKRELKYRSGTLLTEVHLTHEALGLELICVDGVDFHEPVLLRRIQVRDLRGTDRDVRLFFHIDFSIKESPVGDTADFDPETQALVLYKDDFYFLVNTQVINAAGDLQPAGVAQWAIGTKRVGGAEGTWRDAEDGVLGRNAISQGSVDATVGINLSVPPKGQAVGVLWLACGDSYERVRELNGVIRNKSFDKLVTRTDAYWRLWARKDRLGQNVLPDRVRELFVRSQLILRTQIDNRGAIIAATDSDISHFAGDHYAYCWPRDGALVAHSLICTYQSELSRSFFRYCGKVIHKNGYFLHKYTPNGHMGSSWHPWTMQGRTVLPIQQDETALVLWALRQHFEVFKDVEFIKPLYNSLVAQPATWMMNYIDSNGLPRSSWDLWEERRGIHTFTVAATIGALTAAAAFARDFGDTERAETLDAAAERMRDAMLKHLWNPESNCFARMATPIEDTQPSNTNASTDPTAAATPRPSPWKGESPNVKGYRLDMTRDSANYALFAFGALRAGNPMVVAEMESLFKRLWVKTDIGGCARYERDYYHMVERDNTEAVPGNPWVICTLWHAQHKIAVARTLDELRQAMPMLEWAAERARASGVLAEQYHPYTGEMISVSPLTWSHATVVTTVVQYLRRHNQLIEEANTPAGFAEAGVA